MPGGVVDCGCLILDLLVTIGAPGGLTLPSFGGGAFWMPGCLILDLLVLIGADCASAALVAEPRAILTASKRTPPLPGWLMFNIFQFLILHDV